MKLSRTRAFLLELASAGIALGAGITLIEWGAPIPIVIPVVAIVAWYQCGFFMNMWRENKWKMEQKQEPKI